MKPESVEATPGIARDPFWIGVEAALQRSARKALELALQTGTPCYIWRDGCIVNIGAPITVPSIDAATNAPKPRAREGWCDVREHRVAALRLPLAGAPKVADIRRS